MVAGKKKYLPSAVRSAQAGRRCLHPLSRFLRGGAAGWAGRGAQGGGLGWLPPSPGCLPASSNRLLAQLAPTTRQKPKPGGAERPRSNHLIHDVRVRRSPAKPTALAFRLNSDIVAAPSPNSEPCPQSVDPATDRRPDRVATFPNHPVPPIETAGPRPMFRHVVLWLLIAAASAAASR